MRIGVDLGGTKIEAVALSDGGRSLARQRVPSPRDDYRGTLAAIVALVEELEGRFGCRGSVGVSRSVLGGFGGQQVADDPQFRTVAPAT